MSEQAKKESQSPGGSAAGRREFLKGAALVAGAAGASAIGVSEAVAQSGGLKPDAGDTFKVKAIVSQPHIFFYPGETLASDEIRVSIMGSGWGNIVRRRQAAASVFIELGNGDSFVWDMGEGSFINYNVMQVPYSRMDKLGEVGVPRSGADCQLAA